MNDDQDHSASEQLLLIEEAQTRTLLDSKGLQNLIDAGKVPSDSPCMETIWNWLNTNLTESWKAFEDSRNAHQQDLGLRSSDELGI